MLAASPVGPGTVPRTFGSDVAWAARTLARYPSVVAVSVVLAVLPVLTPRTDWPFALVDAVCFVLTLGWYGAERVFFQRARDGASIGTGALFRSALRLIGPFFRLALLLNVVTLVVIWPVAHFAPPPDAWPADPSATPPMPLEVAFVVLFVAVDFALTFVTSALVYTTRSVWRAVRIGFRLIRKTWPQSALYVLCPPLALNLMEEVFPLDDRVLGAALKIVIVVVGLVAKGAIAVFYLREYPGYFATADEITGTSPTAR